ncbi:MAG: universal stress protein [Sandaracinaceae bacterium]|nr:universal stress protein [Sandaracinaceae bacterium]
MTERGPIVCATDLSVSGAEAVEIAARIAAATGRALELVHVGAPLPEVSGEPRNEAERVYRERARSRHDATEQALAKERERAASLGPHASATLLDGRTWEAIIEHAEKVQASLLVVGPHGHAGPRESTRRGIGEWILGSTADRILRHAPCPVLVGPRGDAPAHPVSGGTWVVAIDFSDPSRAALKLAVALAKPCGAKLVALHVTYDPLMRLDPADVEEPFPPRDDVLHPDRVGANAALAAKKHAELVGLVKGELGEPIEVRVVVGEAAGAIAEHAKDVDARLIVMGTHGRTGLSRFLLGSTAERTLRLSAVPVLAVRA